LHFVFVRGVTLRVEIFYRRDKGSRPVAANCGNISHVIRKPPELRGGKLPTLSPRIDSKCETIPERG